MAEMRQYAAAWSVASCTEGKRCFTVRHKHKKGTLFGNMMFNRYLADASYVKKCAGTCRSQAATSGWGSR